MVIAKIPEIERERLNELYKYEILHTPYEKEFDEIVLLASKICGVPISLITLADVSEVWVKARVGLDIVELDRNLAFCAHAILSDSVFEVCDTHNDDRFSDNPVVVGGPQIRFYAGMPLITQSGYRLGTLCVLDRCANNLDENQLIALQTLSRQVIKLFELRVKHKELDRVVAMQQKIIAIMAHDVRSPLSSLKISYDLKKEGFLEDEDLEQLDELVPRQLDSTLQLLNNIVVWSKLQLAGNNQIHTQFKLSDVCEECFGYIRLSAMAKKNALINNIDPSIVINANKDALEFILRNLINNANKFTTAGTICVSASLLNNFIDIFVKDTGVGIESSILEALAQGKSKGTSCGTFGEKGSGIALQLINEYLNTISGYLNFNSSIGNGTEVEIILPELADEKTFL